jgi:cell division protein FtsZ
VQGIIDLITAPGLINLDFADVRSVMQNAGPALIGLGRGTGESRATDAARQAIASPLLEASIEGARGILFNVSGPADLRLREVRQAAEAIREHADPEANVIFGASFSEALGQDVLITLIATGLTTHARTAQGSAAPPRLEAASAEGPAPVVEPLTVAPARRPPKRPIRAAIEAPVEEVAPEEVVPASDEAPIEGVAPTHEAPAKEDDPEEPVRAEEVVPTATQHIQARSAGGPEPSRQPPQRSTSADVDDLDVPSFLRRSRT